MLLQAQIRDREAKCGGYRNGGSQFLLRQLFPVRMPCVSIAIQADRRNRIYNDVITLRKGSSFMLVLQRLYLV